MHDFNVGDQARIRALDRVDIVVSIDGDNIAVAPTPGELAVEYHVTELDPVS